MTAPSPWRHPWIEANICEECGALRSGEPPGMRRGRGWYSPLCSPCYARRRRRQFNDPWAMDPLHRARVAIAMPLPYRGNLMVAPA